MRKHKDALSTRSLKAIHANKYTRPSAQVLDKLGKKKVVMSDDYVHYSDGWRRKNAKKK